MVCVLGGFGPGGYVRGLGGVVGRGIVQITYNYPGGRTGPFASDGVYDYRGMNCIRATRDVVRFALGELTDDKGRRLEEIVGVSECRFRADSGDVRSETLRIVGRRKSVGGSIMCDRLPGGVAVQGHLGNPGSWHHYVEQARSTGTREQCCNDRRSRVLDPLPRLAGHGCRRGQRC